MPGVGRKFGAPDSRALARRVVARWRSITGGARVRDASRRTLIACSGGCDSSALALALGMGAPAGTVVIGHVRHDFRGEAEVQADALAVAALAARVGAPLVERAVRVRLGRGNAEARAREARYGALVEMAREASCGFVAVAHHADDVLETMLMRLVRGAGPAALGGMAAKRGMDDLTLVRPMLDLTRADAEAICRGAGWVWREDQTNADTSRLRAALRAKVIPELRRVAPGAARAAGRSGVLLRDAGGLLAELADAVLGAGEWAEGRVRWDRAALRACRAVVVGEVLRRASDRLAGERGRDRRGVITTAARAVRSDGTDRRVFTWRGVELVVTAREVVLAAKPGSSA